jgi:hypothetical protein
MRIIIGTGCWTSSENRLAKAGMKIAVIERGHFGGTWSTPDVSHKTGRECVCSPRGVAAEYGEDLRRSLGRQRNG